MNSYCIRDVVKQIITKEFYYANVRPDKKRATTEERIFYDLMTYYGIMYKSNSKDKKYKNKWIINWDILSKYYPGLIGSFDDMITDNGFYQPLITEEGITKIREFLYENK